MDAQEDLSNLKLALRSWYERRGISQSALLMKLGISVSHLNAILSGRARPGAALVQKIYGFLAAHQKPRLFALGVSVGPPLKSGGGAGIRISESEMIAIPGPTGLSGIPGSPNRVFHTV